MFFKNSLILLKFMNYIMWRRKSKNYKNYKFVATVNYLIPKDLAANTFVKNL